MGNGVAGGTLDERPRTVGGPRSSLKDVPSGAFSGLSRPSLSPRQQQGRLLLPLVQPRRAPRSQLRPGPGGAGCSSGCGGKGAPVRGRGSRVKETSHL